MLYLADITLQKTRYMGETTKQKVLRLVDADSIDAAELKVRNTYDHCEPGDDSVYVWNMELSPVIM